MPYFLLVLGLFLLFYGGYLLKKENNDRKEEFRELLDIQNADNKEYVKLLAVNQELKTQLGSIENKLTQFLNQVEFAHKYRQNRPEYYSASDNLDEADAAQSTDKTESVHLASEQTETEDTVRTGASANLRKGEVRFIQNLLEK